MFKCNRKIFRDISTFAFYMVNLNRIRDYYNTRSIFQVLEGSKIIIQSVLVSFWFPSVRSWFSLVLLILFFCFSFWVGQEKKKSLWQNKRPMGHQMGFEILPLAKPSPQNPFSSLFTDLFRRFTNFPLSYPKIFHDF